MNNLIATLDVKRVLQGLYAIQHALHTMRKRWGAFLRKYPFVLWLLKALGLVTLVGAIAVTGFLMSIRYGAFGPLPSKADLEQISNPLAADVLAEDGTLLGRYFFEHRSNVPYKNISPHFVNALVATEDARYFHHNGVDLRAWARVAYKTILKKDESAGGGSTITQQLSKNLYPRRDYGEYSLVINKLKEVFIAIRLENLYSKEEILEMYLNTVPFSENTYGIKVASQRFFGVTPDSLNAEQAAVLVAMLKATTTYSPVANPEKSLERRNLVLGQMQKYGYLSETETDSLQKLPLNLRYSPLNHNEGVATHFREHLRLELKKILEDYRKPNGMAYNIYTDGLKIYTTIDPKMQRYAEQAMQEHMKQLQKDFLQAPQRCASLGKRHYFDFGDPSIAALSPNESRGFYSTTD
ncbi:MAG: penicillin-binding protein [Saprospiraceae bacterium]|nr:penicillin-binding protein [Saprospiraceae bacterium]